MNLALEPLNETPSKQMQKNPGQCLVGERDFFFLISITQQEKTMNFIVQHYNY